MSKLHYQEGISQKEKDKYSRYLNSDEDLVLTTGLSSNYLRILFITKIFYPGLIFILLGAGLGKVFDSNSISSLSYGLIVGLILASIVAFAQTKLIDLSNLYLLSSKRLIIKKGFISSNLTSIYFDKIIHLEISQNIVESLFHYGKLIIGTAGGNKTKVEIANVGYPIEFRNILEKLVSRSREQLGYQSGPVVAIEGELVN